MTSLHEQQIDRRLLINLKESLIDLDILVDDARCDVDEAVARLQSAVDRRDTTARRLEQLLAKVCA